MQLKVKAKVIREIYHNDNFYILALSPMKIYDNLEITQYGTFTCKGELSMLTVGQEYDLVIEPISNDKYGTCYKVVDVPSLKVEDLSDDDELEILRTITTNSQADYVHKAYPNFIRLILNGEEDKIDIKNIYNVGETRLKVYKRLINEKFRYYYLMKQTKEYKISMSDCKLLLSKYKTIEECVKKINNTPYFILMEVLGRTFENIDKMILDIQPNLKVSKQRCEALIIGVLRRNEVDGSTRLYANDLFYYIKEEYDAKELLPMLKDVAVESDLIYYDEKTKDLSIMSTYLAECKIADFVKSKIQNSKKLDIDYTKYKNIDNFTMNDSQLNALKVFCESNISILAGHSGCGKAEPVDTIIPTPIGNRRLGDIKVGDYVFDRFGNPTKVLGVFPQGMKDCYTITLSDGRKTQCNDEHLWSYYTSKGNLYTKTLRQMIDGGLYLTQKNGHKNNKYKIPINKAVEYPKRNFDVDPYVIGSFIGNGCCTESRLTLSSADKEQVAEVAKLINAISYNKDKCSYSWHFRTPNPCNNKIYYQTKEILGKYSNEICQLSGNKRIPNEYKYSSIEQRYKLLQGLFDTDGSILDKAPRFNVRYSTTSYGLAKDIQEVLFSLGYSCSLSIDKRPNKNDCYSINVLIPNEEKYKLFRLSRKKERALKAKQYKKHRTYDRISIVDVKKELYQKEMVCILVDNDEHLYLTNDYIVTHNTSAVKGLVSLMEDNHLTYTLLSPTGKASKVLSESTGRKAYTIHKRCFSGSIDTDVVIVDECGMVSLDVFCMLLSAIQNDNARIVLVGDPAQLSSIGLSKIYDDLIKSNKVPMTMLTEVFRYKSNGSLFVATNIRQGKNFFNDDFVKHNENTNEYTVSDNYKFIQTDEVLETVVNEYKKLLQKGIKKENIMVLSPFNVGLFGTYVINNEIQQMINPILPNDKIQSRTVNKTKIVFKEGDLVINTKNDYEAVKADSYYANRDVEGISESDYETTAIVNGQMGIIREVVDKGLIIQFDEEMVYMNRNKLNHLLLGYAISCHKSQGSTIDYSINIVTNAHKNMLSRGLLYVATTRCRKSHIDIGDESAFQYALSVCDNDLRKTWLLDLMTEEK